MDPLVSEWLNLVVRWIHVITGIAWVGASFYFNWLLNHLIAPQKDEQAVVGELWAIHAGGFFKVQKRNIEPGHLPTPLHWFKWEAYWTWISGFLLLAIVYYMGANVYLIDRNVADISNGTAITIGIGTLIGGWFVYDLLWRSPLAQNRPLANALSFLLVVAVAFGLSHVFSGRGAYIHVGAMLGTLMAGNVFRVIMPAQRQLVAATEQGTGQDTTLAKSAELRSLHNNYMTLPVLFIMISNHYPSTFGHTFNWVVLTVLFVVGALVRHYFNVRHSQGNWASAWLLGAAAASVAGLAYLIAPPSTPEASNTERVSFAQVRNILQQRCTSCHSSNPTSDLFPVAPKNIALDTPEQVRNLALQIKAQTVTSLAMPLGNITQMTEAERDVLGQWIDQGAHID